MNSVPPSLYERIMAPGPRLPWITNWLIEEVWSRNRYRKLEPRKFLFQGEEELNLFEQLVASAADRVYSELLSGPSSDHEILTALAQPDQAVVVFDGMSVREIPMALHLAEESGLGISNVSVSLAALPSETMDFVAREFPCGRIAPSQLPNRKELKERNITALYSGSHTQPIQTADEQNALLVWSAFPDVTYRDSGARFENHFENIHAMFETAWMHTVQRVQNKKKIIVTSDHGYIFLGSGMDFPRSSKELNSYFGNERHRSLEQKPEVPSSEDVFVDESRQVAVLKGRIKTRSTGEAGRKLYKHGGLSLMEMLTPWIELERQ